MDNQNNEQNSDQVFDQQPSTENSHQSDKPSRPLQLVVFAIITAGLFLLTIYMYLTNLAQTEPPVPEAEETEVATTTESEPVPNMEEVAAEIETDFGNGQYVNVVVDQELGIYLSHLETDQTLYQRTSGLCEAECLEQWVPYSTSSEFTTDRLRSVLVNEEQDLYYVLLDDRMLFTYFGDDDSSDLAPGDTNGNGVDGVWELARP
jgi:predicted lipoprotein with Yx(FWY)xxD motif